MPIVSNDTIIDYMKPPYEITPKILKLYGRINDAIGQCKSLNLVKPEARLRKQNRIKTIHSSLAIEGNTLSVDQVTAIIENNRVAGPKKDIIEVQNAIKAYDALDSLKTLKMSDYLKSHKILMDGLIVIPGKFRTKQVAIVKGKKLQHVAPKYDIVPGLMKDLFDYLKTDHDLPIIKSCVFHYESEFIHPFEDGNGRMGRLWQTRILMDENPIFEYVPIEETIKNNQEKYYKSLSDSDSIGMSTPFIEFMLEAIDNSLRATISETSVPNYDYEARFELLSKNINGWFDRKEYMKVCKGISTATASRDLKQMVSDGRLIVSGTGRMTKYKRGV